jgi:ADP-ribose pyrophosphatase YjhB (NUDIX family)
MLQPKIYIEDPHHKMSRKFLTDQVYSEAIESFVIVDADVLFINKENKTLFLLARRKAKPMQGLWVIGGRIYAGESERDAICRLTKSETSLEFGPDHFNFLCMNRYVWKDRQQEPQDKGSDNLCYTFTAELTQEERAIVSKNLDPEEYDTTLGLQEFSGEMLEEQGVHPAIIDMHKVLFG